MTARRSRIDPDKVPASACLKSFLWTVLASPAPQPLTPPAVAAPDIVLKRRA